MRINSPAETTRARHAYEERVPGWYTVNPDTDLAVNGPAASRDEAEAYAHAVDQFYGVIPSDGTVLTAVLVEGRGDA